MRLSLIFNSFYTNKDASLLYLLLQVTHLRSLHLSNIQDFVFLIIIFQYFIHPELITDLSQSIQLHQLESIEFENVSCSITAMQFILLMQTKPALIDQFALHIPIGLDGIILMQFIIT